MPDFDFDAFNHDEEEENYQQPAPQPNTDSVTASNGTDHPTDEVVEKNDSAAVAATAVSSNGDEQVDRW